MDKNNTMVCDRNTEALKEPFGIYAKTPSTHGTIDPLTGLITRFKIDPKAGNTSRKSTQAGSVGSVS